jgi:hypothetical protein
MRVPQSTGCSGLTLAETLACMGALTLLTAVIMAATAPARERASEARCLSNLRQISRAIQLYRQDYEGGRPPQALQYADLGLPKYPESLFPTYLQDRKILRCNSEYFPEGAAQLSTSYMWQILEERPATKRRPVPKFSEMVAKRTEMMPIVADVHHGTLMYGSPLNRKPYVVLVLRLNGSVQECSVRTSASWEW